MSEDQLRAALRDGEPDGTGGLSADRLIAQANEIRHRRRVRYGSVLGAVAAAAAAGTLIATIGAPSHSNSYKASSGQAVSNPRDAVGSSRNEVAGNGSAGACPATAPDEPVGTGHGSFFAGPVASIRLCVYAPAGGAPLRATNGQLLTSTLTGTAARQLAASLDAAATTAPAEPCPLFRTATGKVLAIIPVGADGTTMAPITVAVLDNPCGQPVSNGSVVRYDWTPPVSLSPFLHQAATATGPPTEHGSPIKS